jgi:chorismate mutase
MPFNTRPRVPDAATITQRMIDGSAAAGQKFVEGALAPRRDPVQAAIKANARYKANTLAAINEDRFVKGLQGVDNEQTIAVISSIGAQAYTQGVAARKAKIARRNEQMNPILAANCATIDGMPAVTDQDREARMLANLRNMRQMGKTLRGQK